jgi:cardiolipin synthase A/B
MIQNARNRISITSPYYVPDETIQMALVTAGSRGLYRAPTILHAKHLSIDDDVAVIGSSNLDIRSLSLHMELSVLVNGAEFTAAMRGLSRTTTDRRAVSSCSRTGCADRRATGSSTT